ncbi:MAG: tatC [Burkholderiaceae bacterium]|nr:tatC [Burkholderiaceae bacterium]
MTSNLPPPETETDHLAGWMGHLVELRTRIVRASVAVLLVFLVLFYWRNQIFGFFSAPMLASLPEGARMISTEVTSNFFVPIKFALWVAFVIALPVVLYQVWAFVAPGLYAREKKLVIPVVTSSYLLFLIGTAFAYFLVFPTVFHFMAQITPLGVEMATDIDNYLSFGLTMFLAFGLAFEVPVVVVVLVKLGFVSVAQLKNARPYMIVGAFAVSALVTPPDAVSMLLLAVPLVVLYEVGVFVAHWVAPKVDLETED